MLILVVVLVVLTITGVLVHRLLASRPVRQLVRSQRAAIAQEELRAEQRLHQLTQAAVTQMLEAARRR